MEPHTVVLIVMGAGPAYHFIHSSEVFIKTVEVIQYECLAPNGNSNVYLFTNRILPGENSPGFLSKPARKIIESFTFQNSFGIVDFGVVKRTLDLCRRSLHPT